MSRHFGGYARGHYSSSRKIAIFSTCFLFTGLLVCTFFIATSGESSRTVFEEGNINNDVVPVLITQSKIYNGQKLEASMFNIEMRPRSYLSSGFVTDMKDISNKYASALIIAGQPIYYEHLSSSPLGILGDQIPDGYRAVAIRVDDISSVEGFATAESIVDVLWLGKVNNKSVIANVVQKCKVLSAERNLKPATAESSVVPGTVTLLAGAEDAKKITLAQANGSLILHLRNKDDPQVINSGTITIEGLFHKETAPSVAVRSYNGKITDAGITYCIEGSRMFRETTDNPCPL